MRRIVLGLLAALFVLAGTTPGRGEWSEEGWQSVGVRGGLSATQKHQFFHRYELFALYGLPWSLRGEKGWGAAMGLNLSAGALRGASETGFIGGVGPTVVFDKAGGKGIMLELGGDLDVVSRQVFGRQDFNGNLLFEGNIGLTYRFDSGYGIGYAFQHISNGGVYSDGKGNPGLDLHMVGLSFHFR